VPKLAHIKKYAITKQHMAKTFKKTSFIVNLFDAETKVTMQNTSICEKHSNIHKLSLQGDAVRNPVLSQRDVQDNDIK
jgi:hypothetical protein